MVNIKIDKATIMTEDNAEYLKLRLNDFDSKISARTFVSEMPDKVHRVEIKIHRGKRSLTANNYAWKLIGNIAEKVNRNPIEIYQDYIRDIGKFEQYLMIVDAYDQFDNAWCEGHIGRFTRIIGESREKANYIWVAAFLGSSNFNTVEMYNLLQNIRQDCKELDIPYLTPDEEAEMMSRYESQGG